VASGVTRTDDSATRTDDSATRTDERGDGDPLVEVTDVDHVALRVSDLERALEFYHGLLGLPVRDRERYEAGEVPYVACVAGGRHLHLVPTDDPFDPGGEHVCLLVRTSEVDSRAELDALLSALRDAGVAVEAGEPHDRYGAYGRAPAAYVRDPDGRRVELKLH
jgi:catechol 2,3-dioxygenase